MHKNLIEKIQINTTLFVCVLFMLISCFSGSPNNSVETSSPATPSPSPTPSVSYTTTPKPTIESCPIDINSALQGMRYLPKNPLSAINMLEPLEIGKRTLSQVACDSRCSLERNQLYTVTSSYWDWYITISSPRDDILCDGEYGVCRSGCTSFSDGSPSCYQRCEDSRQVCTNKVSNEQRRNQSDKERFFNSVTICARN